MTVLYQPSGILTVDIVTDHTPAGSPLALGEVVDCTFTIDSASEPVYSNESCGPVEIYRDTIGAAPVIECTPRNWSDHNIQMLLAGTMATATGTSTIQIGNNLGVLYKVVLTATNCADSSSEHVWTLHECIMEVGGPINLLTNYEDRAPQGLPMRFMANYVASLAAGGDSGYGTVVMPETT